MVCVQSGQVRHAITACRIKSISVKSDERPQRPGMMVHRPFFGAVRFPREPMIWSSMRVYSPSPGLAADTQGQRLIKFCIRWAATDPAPTLRLTPLMSSC